jgi:hypothetical protein
VCIVFKILSERVGDTSKDDAQEQYKNKNAIAIGAMSPVVTNRNLNGLHLFSCLPSAVGDFPDKTWMHFRTCNMLYSCFALISKTR